MTSKSKKSWITWVLGGGLILGLIFGVWFGFRWFRNIPSLPDQLKTLSDVQVLITSPGDQTTWPADAAIPINVLVRSSQTAQQVDLYGNGNQVASRSIDPDLESNFFIINWQPGQIGPITLFTRVTTSQGSTVVSDPISLTITTPTGAVLEITAQGSETLEDLAEKYGLEPQAISLENPSIDFSLPIPTNDLIRIPIQLPIIPTLPQPDLITPLFPQYIAQDQGQPFWQDLIFYLNSQSDDALKAPQAPTLQGVMDGCDIDLMIGDNSSNETGFIIYRSKESSTGLKQLAILAANPSDQTISYQDPAQTGQVSYVVSAYNSSGENQSEPVFLGLDSTSCPSDAPSLHTSSGLLYKIEVLDGSLKVIDHVIFPQQPVDLAYFYISINGREWERIPAGKLKFLPGTGDQFDLDDYLDDMIVDIPDPKLDIEMELWGWDGGKLIDCGTVKISIERTVLRVCAIANIDCGEDLLRPEIFISPSSHLPDIYYMFTWDTAQRDQVGVFYWQIATHPFTGDRIAEAKGLITSRDIHNETDKIRFDFSYLYNDEPYKFGDWEYHTNIFDSNFFQDVYPLLTPFTLYARVVMFSKYGERMPTSNTVILHYKSEKEPEPEGIYTSDLPSLYDIKFLPETYSGPTLVQDDLWGCIDLLSNVYPSNTMALSFHGFSDNDFNADMAGCLNPVSSTCNQKNKPLLYAAGSRICPDLYSKPKGDFWSDLKKLASGIYSGVTGGWDALVNGFEGAKTYLTEQIASVIPNCGDLCKAAIKKGLEAGFTALTGLPPTLPTYEGLKEDGIVYAIALIVEEIGPDCDDTCKAIIEKGLRETMDYAKDNQTSPGCVGSDAAHARGKEPLCFPSDPRIQWTPASGAVYQPAVISVQVTRKQQVNNPNFPQLKISPETSQKYRGWVDSSGFNATRQGDWFPICGFKEGLDGSHETGYTESGAGFHLKRQINDPLEGRLYQPLDLRIPWLEPGESIIIPLVFSPELFWRTNHLNDVNQSEASYDNFFSHCGDDWPYLYYDGISQLNIVEQCLNSQGKWVPCSEGGQDHFETVNPVAP